MSGAEVLFLRWFDSPVGRLRLIASDSGLRALLWPRHRAGRSLDFGPTKERPDHPVLEQAVSELEAYFGGQRRAFEVPLDLQGTAFQLEVWQRLRQIPYGSTMTYGELAVVLGDVLKTRAVGLANGQNPVSVIVPCHRVVGAAGDLTGFAGGLEVKSYLLQLEQGRVGDKPVAQSDLFG